MSSNKSDRQLGSEQIRSLRSISSGWLHPLLSVLVLTAPFTEVVKAAGAPSVRPAAGSRTFDSARYTPATIRVSFTSKESGSPAVKGSDSASFVDLTLIAPQGDLVGKRVNISRSEFSSLLRALYTSIAKQSSLEIGDPSSPPRRLYDILIRPLLPDLQAAGVTTLLISADAGLQGVPFAALHDGQRYFGEIYAFSLTPSIALTPLDAPSAAPNHELALGSSTFTGLAPLPLVPQEIKELAATKSSQTYLNHAFTPEVLLSKAGDPSVDRVHVATHAEFLPGGPQKAKIYSGQGAVSMSAFAGMRQRREGQLLDLFILSACRTALGDQDSELGFAGLALQAGSRSAVGTLWYVDDVATTAFFVLFYRYLKDGLPKAESIQAARIAFAEGKVRADGNRVLGPDGRILLQDLTPDQRARAARGLSHPYFWAGIQLMGTPW